MRSYKIIATTKNSRNLSKAPYSPNKRCLIIKPTINRYTIFFLGLILHPSGPGGCLFQDGPFYECSDSQTVPLSTTPPAQTSAGTRRPSQLTTHKPQPESLLARWVNPVALALILDQKLLLIRPFRTYSSPG